jgi:hypothetical protein
VHTAFPIKGYEIISQPTFPVLLDKLAIKRYYLHRFFKVIYSSGGATALDNEEISRHSLAHGLVLSPPGKRPRMGRAGLFEAECRLQNVVLSASGEPYSRRQN